MAAQPVARHVPFAVEFVPRVRLPPALLARLQRILGDLATWLDALPHESGYLKAVDGEVAELNLEGWRIEFTVDRWGERIIVLRASRQSEAA
jgi:hypothetical protein